MSDTVLVFILVNYHSIWLYQNYFFQILKVAANTFKKLLTFDLVVPAHQTVSFVPRHVVWYIIWSKSIINSFLHLFLFPTDDIIKFPLGCMDKLWKVNNKFCSKVLRKKYVNLRYYLPTIVKWKNTSIKSHMNAHVPFTDVKSYIKLRKFYFKFFLHFCNGFVIRHFLISTLKQYQINKNLSSEIFCSNPPQLFQIFSLNTHVRHPIAIVSSTIAMTYMILFRKIFQKIIE